MILVFVGMPGCGKGTLGDLLVQKFEFPRIIMSACLEKRAKRNDSIGREIILYKETKKQLVPDSIVNQVLSDELSEYGRTEHIVLDGFPRTVDQYSILVSLNRQHNFGNIIVCSIGVSEEEAIRRMTLERRRPGETAPEVCRQRIADFQRHTVPMIHDMKRDKLSGCRIEVINVDGMHDRCVVFTQLCELLSLFIPICKPTHEREAKKHTQPVG
jgi:adenylate kinase family enzyme